jgi:hypothetical protein
MRTKLLVGVLALMAAAGLSVLAAGGGKSLNKERQAMTLETPGTSRVLQLPAAAEHSKVISLGTAIDPQSGLEVEGLAVINPKPQKAKPDGVGGGDKKPKPPRDEVSSCWAPLAKGAVWKEVEPWQLDPTNAAGLDEAYLLDRMAGDIDKWEDATDGAMDDAAAADVLGLPSLVRGVTADSDSPDGKNEVLFGSIDEPGVIAVTIVWGVFGGPPKSRQLVEWDMVFNQDDFAWSTDGAAGTMDFENISTHELGHSFGLGHPDDTCIEETMYAYADYGETKKRDLNAGDIAGANELY